MQMTDLFFMLSFAAVNQIVEGVDWCPVAEKGRTMFEWAGVVH